MLWHVLPTEFNILTLRLLGYLCTASVKDQLLLLTTVSYPTYILLHFQNLCIFFNFIPKFLLFMEYNICNGNPLRCPGAYAPSFFSKFKKYENAAKKSGKIWAQTYTSIQHS